MVLRLLVIIVLFSGLYGAVMGTFSGTGSVRALQIAYSALKLPLMLLVSFALSLPSFFILNTLFGLRAQFWRSLGSLLAGQAGMTILLASMAPLTLVWNLSATGHPITVLFNAGILGIATLGGQLLLRRAYRVLLAEDRRHAHLLWIWVVTYVFVGIQMGWVLRPFVGKPGQPVTLLRPDAWSNAYIVVFQMVQQVLTR
jgi:hypothetical protein